MLFLKSQSTQNQKTWSTMFSTIIICNIKHSEALKIAYSASFCIIMPSSQVINGCQQNFSPSSLSSSPSSSLLDDSVLLGFLNLKTEKNDELSPTLPHHYLHFRHCWNILCCSFPRPEK